MSCNHHSAAPVADMSNALPEIRVNGEVIAEQDLAAELQYHAHSDFNQVVQKAGQSLVIRQLLLQELAKKGVVLSSEKEESEIQALLDENVQTEQPSEQDCLRYFENNQDKFLTTPLIEVDHILLGADPKDLPCREVAKNKAKAIIEQLKGDPFLFASLAKEYSACPSKEMGGNLGQLSKGQTVPEFEKPVFAMKAGLSDAPVETRYGFHVVFVRHKIDGKPMEYSMVAEKVRQYLAHRQHNLALQRYLFDLVGNAEIEGISVEFSDPNIYC